MFSSNQSNVAASAANYIEDVFSTYLYTGNAATQTIDNGIDLSTKGGLVWAKIRDIAGNSGLSGPDFLTAFYGTPGGLKSSQTAGLGGTDFTGVTSTGYTLGAVAGDMNQAGSYVSWTFREQAKFFDVVTYTGTGSNTTIAHSLGSVPGSIIVKRTDTTAAWAVYHRSLTNTQYLVLNTTAAAATGATWWNSTTPTSSVFSVGTDASVNATGGTYVAYLFAHDAGGFGLTGTDNVITCGSYTTDGSGNATVNLGYEPQWILCKSISAGQNWILGDVMRGWNANSTTNMQIGLRANTTAAENATLNTFAQVTATGFNATINNASDTYIYIAIRRGPMKVPTLGTSVFSPILQSNANTPPRTISGAGFAPDLLFQGTYQYANGTYLYDRLRGQFTLQTCYDNPESSAAAAGASFTMDGITYTGAGSINNNGNAVDWFFKRAPSFFDEVCYTGTGASLTLSHNLTVSPELIIAKKRNGAGQWPVFAAPLVNKYLYLDGSNAASTDSGTFWLGVTPTTFSVADNLSYGTNVAYLFATCAGVSKVGSYTGNGSTQTINCGFGAGGARFVLIKRTDATGDWYVYDTARGMTTLTDPYLLLNLASTGAATLGSVTTVSTGFALNSTILAAINVNAGTYIFFAVS